MGGKKDPLTGRFVKITEKRVCLTCDSDKTYLEEGQFPVWFRYANNGQASVFSERHDRAAVARRRWFSARGWADAICFTGRARR